MHIEGVSKILSFYLKKHQVILSLIFDRLVISWISKPIQISAGLQTAQNWIWLSKVSFIREFKRLKTVELQYLAIKPIRS